VSSNRASACLAHPSPVFPSQVTSPPDTHEISGLVARGVRVGGDLARLVDAVLGGDSPARRATSCTYQESRDRGVHAEYYRLAARGLADAELYAGVRRWLDRRFRTRMLVV
jgi:hypothetical protein